MAKKKLVIIGAGLVGSLLGIFLSRRGYRVSLFERRPDMRDHAISAGRSINLALSDRGIKALEEVGIMDSIREIAIPMHGRRIHNADGSSAFQPYGKEGQYINSVSRGELNARLMDLAEENGVDIFFNRRCTNIEWDRNLIHFTSEQEARQDAVDADLIFGADGAYSAARLTHQLQHDRFQYQQYYIDFGYKELAIPPGTKGEFQLEQNALHIWPRGNYMLIALPNTDASFTCTLFFPFEGNPSFESLNNPQAVREFFNEHFTDASQLMPNLEEQFAHNPTSSLVTIKCYPWVREDKFALIGDAAHAIVPFFGQGMNCGFEDCSVLDKLVSKYEGDWKSILPAFQELRKPDCDAIADLAINNFVEMRDKVADPEFLLQKKIEAAFSKKHPDKWTPAYSMVTFSPEIRYSEALNRGLKQEAIMRKIMQMNRIETIWDSTEIEQQILKYLAE
ncbi:MAG: FAD-dependent monooxygenase [Chitinophagaceae bacterium]|nr:FAD-dependent monooxygenase [Bacteroidota bacterium]MCC6258704.1 FAD-dependent monooxygenase [Chitinophagaceae bacterium]MCW5916075.1 FAD-dependent monooxygenase [Ferruginibacter sp.]